MTKKYSRFSQAFIRNLSPTGPERDFVSSLGDIDFLLRTSNLQDKINAIDWQLRKPMLTEGESFLDNEIRSVTFSNDFESVLTEQDSLGSEFITALNGLRGSIKNLQGRSITWLHLFKNEIEFNDAYIMGSQIGFDSFLGFSPDLYINLQYNPADAPPYILYPIRNMLEIAIPPR